MPERKKLGASSKTLLYFYKAFVRPVLETGYIVTADAKKTHLNKLQKVQNYALRIALSLPVYTEIATLHMLGDCDMIEERLKLLKSQAINRYQNSEVIDDKVIKTLLLKK